MAATAAARAQGAPLHRVWFGRGVDEGEEPAPTAAAALVDAWEWRALYAVGADVVSRPGPLAETAADLAAHLPGLTAAPGFRCASLARVEPGGAAALRAQGWRPVPLGVVHPVGPEVH